MVFRFANSFVESFWNRTHIESVQITMAEEFGVQGRGAFYDTTGAIRDVIQNHLFQVLSNLAMEPPARLDSESIRDEKAKVLKAIAPIDERNLVRGQFYGYRDEKGVAQNSLVETFAALKLEVNSWRWKGVPFYIRAGKCLPVTCTEVVARFRKPPSLLPDEELKENHVRLRINPDVTIAMGMTVMSPGEEIDTQPIEMVASRNPLPGGVDAYERVLGAAMEGDSTWFAREDYVEEAWRIVDPVLRNGTPIYGYEANTWGPVEVERVTPPGGWSNPTIDAEEPKTTDKAASR
jgi:glucose-6-phosphate 1-dehydrogenase